MGSSKDNAEASDNEMSRHEVTFAKPFAIGRYEVSFEEYELFAHLTGRGVPGDSGWGTGGRPVINVIWEDVVAYADWLSKETGKSYCLPTEAEWEQDCWHADYMEAPKMVLPGWIIAPGV